MKSFQSRFSIILVLVLIPALLFAQGKRFALVIGNSDYQNAGYLLNPENDAFDIGKALRNTGFEVIEQMNLELIEMKRSIDQFGDLLRNYDVGLFYYAVIIPLKEAGRGVRGEGDWLL